MSVALCQPDILAPGQSLLSVAAASENADGNSCSLKSKTGTSMATPVRAGMI